MNQLAQSGSERWIAWMADLGLAYIGGVVVGAPVGLLFRAATRLDAALTTTMIVTMAAVLVCCRRRRGHPLPRESRQRSSIREAHLFPVSKATDTAPPSLATSSRRP